MPLTKESLRGIRFYSNGEPANAEVLNRPLSDLQGNDEKLYDFFRGIVVNILKRYLGPLTSGEAVLLNYPYSFTISRGNNSSTISFNGFFEFIYRGIYYRSPSSITLSSSLSVGQRYYLVAELSVPDYESYVTQNLDGESFETARLGVYTAISGLQDEPNLHYFIIGSFVYKGFVYNEEKTYVLPNDFEFSRYPANDIGALDNTLVELLSNFETEFFRRFSYFFDSIKRFISSVFTPGILPTYELVIRVDEEGYVYVDKLAAVLADGEIVFISQSTNTNIKARGDLDIWLSSVNFKPVFSTTAAGLSALKIAEIRGGSISRDYVYPVAKLRATAGIVFEGRHNVKELPREGELRYSRGFLAYALQDANPNSFAVISTYNASPAAMVTFGYYNSSNSSNVSVEYFQLLAGSSKNIVIPAGFISGAVAYIELQGGSTYYYTFESLRKSIFQPIVLSASYQRQEDVDKFEVIFSSAVEGGSREVIELKTGDNITGTITSINLTIFFNLRVDVEFGG